MQSLLLMHASVKSCGLVLCQILASGILLDSVHRRGFRFVNVIVHVELLRWDIFLTALASFLVILTIFIFFLPDSRT